MNSCLVVLGLEAFRMLRGDHLDDQVISILGIITFFTIGNAIVLIVEKFSEYLKLTKLVDVQMEQNDRRNEETVKRGSSDSILEIITFFTIEHDFLDCREIFISISSQIDKVS